MWASLNAFLKRRAPAQHRTLKKIVRPWMDGQFNIPAPKKIGNRLCWVHPRVLTAESTEPHVLAWIQKCLSPGQVFFDVGAHYGWMSLIAAQRVGHTGRVIAFEPVSVLVDILRYHKRINRLKQIEIVVNAVCDVDCQSVPFHLMNNGLSSGNSLVAHESEAPTTEIRVGAITLDAYCLRDNVWPDVLKIDVEGGELLVLKGAAEVLSRKKPRLIVALHPPWLAGGQTAAEFFDFLTSRGYRVQNSQLSVFEGEEFGDYLFSCEPAGECSGTSL